MLSMQKSNVSLDETAFVVNSHLAATSLAPYISRPFGENKSFAASTSFAADFIASKNKLKSLISIVFAISIL